MGIAAMYAVLCLQEICAPVWFVLSGTASAATPCLQVMHAVPYLSPAAFYLPPAVRGVKEVSWQSRWLAGWAVSF